MAIPVVTKGWRNSRIQKGYVLAHLAAREQMLDRHSRCFATIVLTVVLNLRVMTPLGIE